MFILWTFRIWEIRVNANIKTLAMLDVGTGVF